MKIFEPLLKDWPITQRFETKVTYMRTGIHSGIDYACPKGTDLLACFDGMVIKTENVLINSGYGRAIWIRSLADPSLVALYGHTNKLLAVQGTQVRAGQIIALSGNSGFVFSAWGGDGSHLHFGLQQNGKWIDPLPFFEKEAAPTVSIPVKDETSEYDEYIVKAGDTLYAISKRVLGNPNKWKNIWNLNKDIIPDPKKIYPGQRLKIEKQ